MNDDLEALAAHLGSVRPDDLQSAVDKLNRYGLARDRATDPDPRIVTLTDDEAMAVLIVVLAAVKGGQP